MVPLYRYKVHILYRYKEAPDGFAASWTLATQLEWWVSRASFYLVHSAQESKFWERNNQSSLGLPYLLRSSWKQTGESASAATMKWKVPKLAHLPSLHTKEEANSPEEKQSAVRKGNPCLVEKYIKCSSQDLTQFSSFTVKEAKIQKGKINLTGQRTSLRHT